MTGAQDEKVVFLHIAKTGGTSIASIVARQFIGKPGAVIIRNAPEHIKELVARPQSELQRLAYISGHVWYGIHEIWTVPASYFAFLREPIARAISSYNYYDSRVFRGRVQPGLHGEFEEYMHAPSTGEFMTNRFAGYRPGQPGVPYGDELGVAEKQSLAEAHLKRLRVVGLTEEFDTTLLLLRKAYGWRNIYYVTRNVTANKKGARSRTVSAELREELRTTFAPDFALYESARAQFAEACRAYGETLDAELARYRRNNAIFGRVYEATERLRGTSIYRTVRRLTGGLLRS